MRQLIKIEIERAFKNKMFYLSLLFALTIVGFDIYKNMIMVRISDITPIIENEKLAISCQIPNVFSQWTELSTKQFAMLLHFILPILTALPYSMTIYSDIKKNYINNIAVRIDKQKYYFSKLFTQFIVGGAIAAIPAIVSLIAATICLPVIQPQAAAGFYHIASKNLLFGDLFILNPYLFCVIAIVIDFVGFGLINCIAYIFANLLNNAFMVILSPFIIYFLQYVACTMIGRHTTARDYLFASNIRYSDILWILFDIIILVTAIIVTHVIKCKHADLL